MKNLFKKRAHLTVLMILIFFLGACKKNNAGGSNPPITPDPPLPVTTSVAISIDKSVKFQTIQGFGFFGGQDAWWSGPQDLWNAAWGEKVITDLGITMWRNEIFPPATPTAPQDANWAKQKPVVEGLKAIADRNNVNLKFLATVWSPPADLKWTANLTWAGDPAATRGPGTVSTKNGGTLNPNKYPEYADWLKANIQLYKNLGIDLYGLSLQNELMFSQSFNSCTYTSAWYNQMVNGVAPLIKATFPNVKIFGSENMLEMEGRDNGWPVFYHSGIKANATTAGLIDVLAVHGYSDGVAASSGSELSKMWTNHAAQFTTPMNKEAWMTETSGYVDTWETSAGKPGAINLAMDMHSGLYYGNISAWVWWQGSGGANGPIGEFELMKGTNTGKKYAASKHFYRYIRPGAIRVKTTSDNETVFVTAYENIVKGTNTIVIINNGDAKSITLTGTGLPASFKMYRSSAAAGENCTLIGEVTTGAGNKINVPAKSIVTLQAGGDAL